EPCRPGPSATCLRTPSPTRDARRGEDPGRPHTNRLPVACTCTPAREHSSIVPANHACSGPRARKKGTVTSLTIALLPRNIPFRQFGGANRIRTGDQGFADPCLTTWLWRRLASEEPIVG